MNNEELAPHVERIKKVLNREIDDDLILRDLNKFVNENRLNIEDAVNGIIRKYGNDSSGFVTGENVVKKITELNGNEQNVDIVAKVVFVQKKTIPGKNGGSDRTILSGIMGDETGTASFTEWSGEKELNKGGVYRFNNCYTKLWNNNVQIHIGSRGTVETSDANINVKERDLAPVATVTKKIADLDGTERSVDVVAKVIFSEKKEIVTKDGNRRVISSGILGDETATISFTLWNDTPTLDKGSVYNFKNCYTRKWNDDVQINIGTNGSVEASDVVIDNVPGRQRPISAPTELKIGEVREGSGNVTVVGRVLSIEKRDIETRNGPRTVYSGTIADDTGEIQYSAWNEPGFKTDGTYRITNAYIRSWKGIPQLNIGDNSEIQAVNVSFDDSKIGQGNERTVGDIAKNGGGMDIIIRGAIVDIRPGSGIIKRCPECKRTIINNDCKMHGTVEPVPDLRMKIIVDDGTGSIATTMDRACTERFTGVSFDAAFNLQKARGEDIVVKELSDKLYMKHVKIRGNAMIDEFGLKINAKEIVPDDVDVKQRAKELLDEVEGML